MKEKEIPADHVKCPNCNGFGAEDVFINCDYCNGTGHVDKNSAAQYKEN